MSILELIVKHCQSGPTGKRTGGLPINRRGGTVHGLNSDHETPPTWQTPIADFTGEIRDGRLPGGRRFMVTIEPMHGTTSAIYGEPSSPLARWPRLAVLHDQLKDGHALAHVHP